MQKSDMATRPRPRPARPDQHLALRYFRLGEDLIKKRVDFERRAAQYGLEPSPATRYKSQQVARHFAGESGDYSAGRAELKELCKLRSSADDGIGWSHVIELLQVAEAERRRALVELTLKRGLDAAALRQVIRRHGQAPSLRAGGGRKRRQPRGLTDAVWRAKRDLESLRFTLSWLREHVRRPRQPSRGEALARALSRLEEIEATLRRVSPGACQIIENYAAARSSHADESQ